MKRISIITLILTILFVFLGTGCTCTDENGTIDHGCGYSCLMLCSNHNVDGTKLQRYTRVKEGIDYSKPEITFAVVDENQAQLDFYMRAYSEFVVKIDICVVQDGIILDRCSWEQKCIENDEIEFERIFDISRRNPEGGEIHYILNKLEAKREIESKDRF